MSKTDNTSTDLPEGASFGDVDLDALLDELFGGADRPEPEFTEKQSTTNYVGPDNYPVRITIEYQTGHAYEAAKAQMALGSKLSVASFVWAFPDESTDAALAQADLTRESLEEKLFAVMEVDMTDPTSASSVDNGDPLAIVRDGADIDALRH